MLKVIIGGTAELSLNASLETPGDCSSLEKIAKIMRKIDSAVLESSDLQKKQEEVVSDQDRRMREQIANAREKAAPFRAA